MGIDAGYAERTHEGMGTVMTHRAFGPNARRALEVVVWRATELEAVMSRFVPESEISTVNRLAGASDAAVGPEVFAVLKFSTELSRSCERLFDVTVGPLVDLWAVATRQLAEGAGCGGEVDGAGSGADGWHRAASIAAIPDEDEIRRCLQLVDYADVELDPLRGRARLRRPGQSIDLGGVAKGYAADAFAAELRHAGVRSAFTNIGGNVATVGGRPDGSPWQVGIRHPRASGELIAAVQASGVSVVTSGDYERFFVDGLGGCWCHILVPRTGYPASSGLVSVTVVAESSMQADALSTLAFVAGLDLGITYLAQHDIVGAVLIDENLSIWASRSLLPRLVVAGGAQVRTF